MQLRLLWLLALFCGAAMPAQAACVLVMLNGGTLKLSSDDTQLSTEGTGTAATFTVVNTDIFGATVTITAPQWSQWPVGFNTGTATNQLSYTGAGLLGSVSQGYTSSQSSFGVPGLLSLATVVTMNNTITSTGGFNQGTYSTKTTVTCS